ncbi:acetylcholine receptor subunit alpha-L1-like [Mercenaria mercenaria]|uniref:acetylcholine receptor subunit alpha-L1-like n=1 Tax=Mercenaria mercenaria TaxID=6596 RepID=UPI00234EFA2B|nr:acetylcholine receptor subunit alpha-L1-like [Mercenaria mercenaria]XP_053405761.1 acetylcholine receptor subunit alpha-L1-like [Mercenaria mercenaria]
MGKSTHIFFVMLIMFMLVRCKPPTEQRLHRYLLQENAYNKLIRPWGRILNGTVNFNDSKLTVQLGMRLSQILAVSEKNQILTTNLRLRHEWVDQRLRWNPSEFGGITLTYIPSDDLWRPDILLYNNADGEFVVTLLTKATVYHTGLIVWDPPAIYKSYCPINVEFFPFDQQECFMKFSVWTYDGHEVDLQHVWEEQGVMQGNQMVIPKGVDLCDYYQNVEWDIINVTARRKEKFYPCCPEPYPDITFNITIRRRSLFYTINLIMPCIAISCLTVLVFYLPSASGEKITLSISILLALTVFFLLLSDINPPTSIVIPLIGKYLLFTMIVVTMSIFLTVYTLSVHFRSPATHKMSPWVKRIFTEILPKFFLMKRPVLDKKKKEEVMKDIEMVQSEMGTPDADTIFNSPNAPNYENLRKRTTSEKKEDLSRYPVEIRESLKGVKFIAEHLKKDDSQKSEERDWNYVAMVIDRMFLCVFTTACVCGTLGVFLNAPSLFDPSEAMSKHDFSCST